MKHDVEKLIQCALDIYLIIPPNKLLQKTEERRATIAGQNSSPSNFSSSAKNSLLSRNSALSSLFNQRLVFYGALTVLALALAWHRFFNPGS